MGQRRPRIGITQGEKRKQSGWWLMWLAVWLGGGRPCLITATRPKECESIDGLVIGGGTDVYPGHYQGEIKPHYQYDQPRDTLELAAFCDALAQGLPILGICRGAQLMNVARGGTLCLDVAKTYEKANYPSGLWARFFYRKSIRITHGSILEALIGREACRVNSMHTQSVLKVGEGLEVTSLEENGVVQSIEDRSRPFVLGVQFHPEYLIHRARFRRLFKALAREAVRHRAARA